MPSRIAQLRLANFRGASQPLTVAFDQQKTIILIFGENGTGKSTLVDAIDAVANQSLGSIAGRGTGQAHQYLRAVSAAGQPEVELITKAGHGWRATLKGRNLLVQAVGSHGKIQSPVHVLRRSKLLKLLEDAPADRYAAMKHFLDVAAVEDSEAALRASHTALDNDCKQKEDDRRRYEGLLHAEWQRHKLATETATTALEWARGRLQENMTILREQAEHLGAIRQLLSTLAINASHTLACGKARQKAENADKQAKAQLADLVTATHSTELVALLHDTLSYLQQPSVQLATCPVCTQLTDETQLRASLAERLQGLQATVILVNAARTAALALQTASSQLQQASRILTDQLDLLATLLATSTPAALAGYAPAWAAYQAAAATEPALKTRTAYLLAAQLQTGLSALEAESQALTAQVELFDSLQNHLANLESIARKLAETEVVRARLKQALAIVTEQRKLFTQRVLDSITAEVNRLYAAIHPAENIGLDRLEMDPNRRASLTQRVNFVGHAADVPPQAYFSEAHLDTLGFCMWLALAKLSGAQEAVLVLDDVFTSVDFEHFNRITDLLDVEAHCFKQIIIATHSRRWYDRYQRRRDNVHLLRLERWSLAQGIQVFSEKTFVAELEASLAQIPLNRRDVATQAGVLLEELLHTIAARYRCFLPFYEVPKFNLSELLRGTASVLKVAKVTRLKADLAALPPPSPTDQAAWETIAIRPLFEAVNRQSTEPRNAGAHYSTLGLELADEEIENFATAALALAKALTCPTCLEVPHKVVDGSYLGCSCRTLKMQLVPVQRPS
ncbi:AAA family ATPase [Hymenobacter setariae]|nr:AAA family ATPase [Hymenobacter setariae]